MPVYDRTVAGTLTRLDKIYDRTAAGVLYPHNKWWDRTVAGTLNLVYSADQYLIKDSVPMVNWSIPVDLNYGMQGNTGRPRWHMGPDSATGTVGYGPIVVQGFGDADDPASVFGVGISTVDRIDFSNFNYITFQFEHWARDGSEPGYYKTTGGIFDNRLVGYNGNPYSTNRPSSMIIGLVCNEGNSDTAYTWDISGVPSAYVGMATCGGYIGNGYVTAKNIWLHN